MRSVSSIPTLLCLPGISPIYLRMVWNVTQAWWASSSLFNNLLNNGSLMGALVCLHRSLPPPPLCMVFPFTEDFYEPHFAKYNPDALIFQSNILTWLATLHCIQLVTRVDKLFAPLKSQVACPCQMKQCTIHRLGIEKKWDIGVEYRDILSKI